MAGKVTTTVENRDGQTIILPSELVRYIGEYDNGFMRALKATPMRPKNGNEPKQTYLPKKKPMYAILLEYEEIFEIDAYIMTNIRDAFPEEITHRVVYREGAIPFPEF